MQNPWGALLAILTLVLLGVISVNLDSESLTLTTSYPAPSGVYQNMVVTGQTTLARDGGNVVIISPANTTGNVGVGTNAPQTPAPNGAAKANLTANDIYLQSTGQWVSKQSALPNMQVFTANGTFTVPAGITRIMVEAWGGGGGGGSAWQQGGGTNSTANADAAGGFGSPELGGGGGGGGGGYSRAIFSVTPAASYSVTVGAGGASAIYVGYSGSPGGPSRLKDSGGTVLVNAGGGGGGGYAQNCCIAGGGAGGSASGGQLNLAGSSGGESGWDYYGNNYAMGGSGGGAAFGGHGAAVNWGAAGIPGGGGAGQTAFCCGQLTSWGIYGTAGAAGLVIIWY